jgi:DNA polymerase III alpha subunit
MTDGFVHLHAHSHYSFLDGASSPETLARRAAHLGQGALALTDWSGLYGAVAFAAACELVGVRPIFGAEIALRGRDGTPGPHLTLLVRNKDGWRSLCRLLSAAQLAGGKGHAPVARALLAAHTAGLLCLSGCRHGALAAPLLAGDEDGAWAAATWLRDLFGDDLWVEVPRNDRVDDGPLGRRLAALAARLGVGVVATANVHNATPEEGPLADTLACIRAGTTLEAARHLRPNHRHHLASGDEMAARYRDLPAAVANTAVVAAHCAFALDHDRHVFPAVPLPPARTPDTHLRALCRAASSVVPARMQARVSASGPSSGVA